MEKFRGQSIGWGPFRSIWYSICSIHKPNDSQCDMCMAGHYKNVTVGFFGHLIYRFCYPLWYWWVNRPNSKARKHLEEIFPNLNGDSNGEK